jgi:hypothetical protein
VGSRSRSEPSAGQEWDPHPYAIGTCGGSAAIRGDSIQGVTGQHLHRAGIRRARSGRLLRPIRGRVRERQRLPGRRGRQGRGDPRQGGQLAWWRSFLRSPIPTPSPKEEKIVSARLWNDATFDYSVKAGTRFTSTRQGEPTKQFFSNDLNFEMPRRGTIRLRFKLEEKQHWEWMTPSPQAGQTALARFRALFPTLDINEAMFRDVVIGRDNSGKILFAFFYLTGAVKLELPPRPTTGSLP